DPVVAVPARPGDPARARGRRSARPRGGEAIRHDGDGSPGAHASRAQEAARALRGDRTMKISDVDCAVVQTALRRGRTSPAEESHLFRCRACRAEARLAAAWKSVPAPESSEER